MGFVQVENRKKKLLLRFLIFPGKYYILIERKLRMSLNFLSTHAIFLHSVKQRLPYFSTAM